MQETVANTSKRTASKPKKPKKKKTKLRIILLTLLALLVLGGGAYAYYVYQTIDKAMDKATEDPYQDVTSTLPVDTSYSSSKPISVVMLGRDSRPETGSANTDVMIVGVIDPDTKKVTMISIPRDTRVKIPGYRGYHKVNAVFANGEVERRQAKAKGETPTENGITLTKKTLEQVLGIPINHYVEVDFNGFKAVVDAVGGVEVNIDRRLVYDDPTDNTHINLNPGQQVLNGKNALDYVRHRHDNRGTKYYSNDFDRNQRQQEVIKAIMNKMLSIEGFAKLPKVIETTGDHVHTDFSKQQILGIATDFKSFNMDNFIVVDSGAFWSSSTSYTLLPTSKKDEIRQALQAAMKLDSSELAKIDYNDSPFDNQVVEYVNNSKSNKKQQSSKPKESVNKVQSEAKGSETNKDATLNEQQQGNEQELLDNNGQNGVNGSGNDGLDNNNGSSGQSESNSPPADIIDAPNFQQNTPASNNEMTPPPVTITPSSGMSSPSVGRVTLPERQVS
ncbi:LCP family protein [Brevibacillus laterosporus]|uniref:LCP family protein n=1 Tax=Brevibacillus laterosporus TaxID=1465 RepID=UPI00036A6364|nr:LCP family protein [Brevibacillus laterosporus]ATO48486.1 transcriptional regulator [Brevibacillus laterosporus DSM 25]AYB41353.1 LytR family transcriptional regulator [Brevibacillus laterosporus]MBG9772137.1 transcriptional regulator [Brevibacillus laterosporus]MBG9798282.1 transcriptional regulator [Brevibacillus laterosporus]MBG9802358.1 transcriptional regulator [Brevibacillus laterosporus]